MLKKVCIRLYRNLINENERKVFCDEMAAAGITVDFCSSIAVDTTDTELMLITDRVIHQEAVSPEQRRRQSCMVGYGIDYAGTLRHIITTLDGITAQYLRMIYAHERGEPAQIAQTRHLVLREMCLTDMEALYGLYDTLKDCPYIEPLYTWEEELEFTKKYIEHMYGFYQYGLWLVFEKESGQLVGRAGIENRKIDGAVRQELGYLIGKPWQHKGYAMEICTQIIKYGFHELDLEYLFLCTHKKNQPSISLAKKLGFSSYAADVDGMNIYYKSKA